ncbi:MAG: hypothetical protein RL641_524 [Candidatus Parcubacteria bacterium]|jgi:tRNA A-37 threonylcarbamoyl transferase component Bud32
MNFNEKPPERLENQLGNAEAMLGGKVAGELERDQMLGMSLPEIKSKYPEKYAQYLYALKDEAAILHFPDMNIEKNENPKISLLSAGARGYGFKIETQNGSHVIKPLEALKEKDISKIAGELGIGPKQFATQEGYIHEEFIEGTLILKLEDEKCIPAYMESLGQKFAKALKKLHENNILVNDQILTDDFGKSHMIIDREGEVRFIDFGASIDISNFPEISDEEVMSLMRTDPMMAFRMHGFSEKSQAEKENEIKGYRENILSQFDTKEEIIKWKDEQLLYEGLSFLRNRLANVGSFYEGIQKEMAVE